MKSLVLLLLLAEAHSGTPSFWWSCGDRPENGFAERTASHLSDAGFKVLDRCDQLDAPVHKSYHKAELAAWQLVNLGSVADADQVVSGVIKIRKLTGVPELGLIGVGATLELTVTDVKAGKAVSQTTLTAEGYDNDPALARKAAMDILWIQLPQLRPSAKVVAHANMRVTHLISSRIREALDALRKTKGVSAARVASLTRSGATFEVYPVHALDAATQTLTALGLTVTP